MNDLISFKEFSKKASLPSDLSDTSVVVDKKGIAVGFVFGRDAFISFLERIDTDFEEKIKDPKKALDNPAGKLIDMIEEKLTVNPKFIKEIKSSVTKTKKSDWIPLKEVVRSLHV